MSETVGSKRGNGKQSKHGKHSKRENILSSSTKASKDGKAKNTASASISKDNKPKKIGNEKKGNRTETSQTILKAAVEAMGGDQSDLDLVKDVSSDEEIKQEDHEEDPALRKEVANFIKTLGLSKKSNEEAWVVEEATNDEEESPSSQDEGSEAESEQQPVKPSSPTKDSSKQGKFVFPPTARWYEALEVLDTSDLAGPSEHVLESLSSKASDLLDNDTTLYTQSSLSTGTSSADAAFLSRVLSSGTLSDRLSALTLMVQASPVHNTKALEGLRSLAMKKGGKGEALKAVRAIVDWWVGGGAPDRKLRYLRDQPLLHAKRTDSHLVVWYFEDWLKKFFFTILQILEPLSLDPLPYIRTQTMALIAQLLVSKPEQEQNLLRLLVNKLGDSERAVASKASYHLHNLLQMHPQMKGVVVREVSALVLKPPSKQASTPTTKPATGNKPEKIAINVHARYYAVVTFNQIVLSSKTQAEKEVAARLVEVYFQLFRSILGERDKSGDIGEDKDEGDTKDGKGREERRKLREKDKLRQRKQNKPSQKSGDGLADAAADADSKITSAILTGVNRALPFAGIDNAALDRHMDTLFRITHEASFNVSIQALVLIQRVSETRPSVQTRYLRTLYASLLDHRLATSSKQAMYLNLLFKSLKLDNDLQRVKAFVKRFLQALLSGPGYEPSFICGGLFLLGELFTVTPGLRLAITKRSADTEAYDPRKREPEYSGAGTTCFWELTALSHHYHPSVSLHARQLLEGIPLTANADLALNTLSHFLDLFVYKNPKKPKPRGASAMQPAAALTTDGNATVRMIKGMGTETVGSKGTVNEEDFWRRKVEDVPVNQLFFHKFFNQRQARSQLKKDKIEKRRRRGSDDENGEPEESDHEAGSDESELDEEEVWKAMKRSLPTADAIDIDSDDSEGLPDPEESHSEVDVDSQSEDKEGSDASNDQESEQDEPFDLGEDADDILDSDAEAPDGLLHFGSDEEEEWGGINSTVLGKRKGGEQHGGVKKKRRLKDLPLFASMEDYEKLIDAEPEDNI